MFYFLVQLLTKACFFYLFQTIIYFLPDLLSYFTYTLYISVQLAFLLWSWWWSGSVSVQREQLVYLANGNNIILLFLNSLWWQQMLVVVVVVVFQYTYTHIHILIQTTYTYVEYDMITVLPAGNILLAPIYVNFTLFLDM